VSEEKSRALGGGLGGKPMEVGLWGPPQPPPVRKAKPGLRHVVSGILGAVLFPLIPTIVFIVIQSRNYGGDEQTPEEILAGLTSSGPFLLSSMFLTWFGLLLPVYFAGRLVEGGWKQLVGWRFRFAWDIPIGLGVALGIQLLLAGLAILLTRFGINTEELGNTGILSQAGAEWVIFLGLGAAIGAPIAEEIFFRGLTLKVAITGATRVLARHPASPETAVMKEEESPRGITQRLALTFGVLSSSLLFGLLHLQNTLASTLYTVGLTASLGVVLAIVTVKAKRLGTAVITHAAFNSVSVIAVAITIYS